MKSPGGSVWLHRLAILTAGATFLLIIAGALVVGNEAGLAVPDWPLSYGTWMPPMEGGVFYEHGHRMVAATVGLLTTLLAIGLWRTEPRRWVRRLGGIALLVVIAQAVLGGVTVLYLLSAPVVIGHASLAQLFFCLALGLALFTSPAWDSTAEPLPHETFPAFRQMCAATTVAVFLQLILGAALRHEALGLMPHLFGAGVLSILIPWLVYRAVTALPTQNTLVNLSIAAAVLLFVQLGLGLVSYLLRLAAQQGMLLQSSLILATTAHVAVGALLLGTSWLVTLLAYRRLGSPAKAFSLRENPKRALA